MRKYTESYPTVCIGRIIAYPLYSSPQDCRRRAFDIHLGNQSIKLVSRVRRVQKGHTVTHVFFLIYSEDVSISFCSYSF